MDGVDLRCIWLDMMRYVVGILEIVTVGDICLLWDIGIGFFVIWIFFEFEMFLVCGFFVWYVLVVWFIIIFLVGFLDLWSVIYIFLLLIFCFLEFLFEIRVNFWILVEVGFVVVGWWIIWIFVFLFIVVIFFDNWLLLLDIIGFWGEVVFVVFMVLVFIFCFFGILLLL